MAFWTEVEIVPLLCANEWAWQKEGSGDWFFRIADKFPLFRLGMTSTLT